MKLIVQYICETWVVITDKPRRHCFTSTFQIKIENSQYSKYSLGAPYQKLNYNSSNSYFNLYFLVTSQQKSHLPYHVLGPLLRINNYWSFTSVKLQDFPKNVINTTVISHQLINALQENHNSKTSFSRLKNPTCRHSKLLNILFGILDDNLHMWCILYLKYKYPVHW